MKNLINKNNIWLLAGIVLLVLGQFFHKDNFSGYGIEMETNLVQLVGSVLVLHPLVIKIIEMYKNKKGENNDSQS
jgi:hypothetical protein